MIVIIIIIIVPTFIIIIFIIIIMHLIAIIPIIILIIILAYSHFPCFLSSFRRLRLRFLVSDGRFCLVADSRPGQQAGGLRDRVGLAPPSRFVGHSVVFGVYIHIKYIYIYIHVIYIYMLYTYIYIRRYMCISMLYIHMQTCHTPYGCICVYVFVRIDIKKNKKRDFKR